MNYTTIKGEVNVLRYLSRLGPPAFNYELNSDPATSARLDGLLDTCYTLARCRTVKEQQLAINELSGYLGKGRFMVGGNAISIADVAVWSVLRQIDVRLQRNMSSDMKRWLQHCSQLLGCGKFYIFVFICSPSVDRDRYGISHTTYTKRVQSICHNTTNKLVLIFFRHYNFIL
jgi:hypothetical protein